MDEEECAWYDVSCNAGNFVRSATYGAIEDMAQAVLGAFENSIASLGTLWVNIGTPNLTGTGGGSSITPGSAAPDAGNITVVLSYVTWISLGIAVLSLFILGALIATRMRAGEGIAAVGKIGLLLASVVLISSASALVSGILPSGPSNASGAVLFLQSGLWWYMGAAAVVSVIIGGARMAWEQRAEPGRETVKSLLTLVVVAGAGTTIVGLLVAAADAFSVWIINGSLECDVTTPGAACFESNLNTMLALTSNTAASGLGPLLIIILGLIAILTSAFQIVLMVARGGMLVILTGILPLSASFTNTEMGKNWFRKCVSWLVAFILYKPAAAIVYAASFQLVGTNVFTDDGSGLLAILTGLMLMLIALFALPALLRFVTPMVGAMAGGAAGGALAMGALAALPSGAAALGRLGAGNSGSSSAQTSNNGGDGPTGPSGPTGGDGGGNNASQGGQSTGPQGGANSGGGPATTSGSSGTSGASSGGSGAMSGGGGAGAAAGGGTAAGAAAGPVGIAAGVAIQAGQKAGQAAQSLGEDATGEGGGPDGSR